MKCGMPKCRNVGRTGYDLVTEDGEPWITVDNLVIPVCRKHLIQAIEEHVDRLEGKVV